MAIAAALRPIAPLGARQMLSVRLMPCLTLAGTSSMRLGQSKDREFGNHLRKLRLGRGFTQEALAERSNLSVDAIRRVEHGGFSPSLRTVSKLAHGLDISLKTMFESFHRRRRALLSELCDFLETLPARDIMLAWQVTRAIFETGAD